MSHVGGTKCRKSAELIERWSESTAGEGDTIVTFVKMAPKSGAPRKYTRFQGRIPCIDARMGLWAQNAYLAKDWGRSGVIVGEVVEEGGI